jgi:hypothetical protein
MRAVAEGGSRAGTMEGATEGRGPPTARESRYVDYELMDMGAMFAPTLADMRAKRK